MTQALRKHARADWGELCDEDLYANDMALLDGSRLLSSYSTKGGIKFWIITEADRSATTVLLPEEY
ncbi:MAG: plasmid related protein [Planctomycetota bacterium]